ncbi:MAG: efflux RND transporter periplasmic adaptor subunit [Terriglobia bacterium]|jgi:RND family efflux transporter MFP subunit
MITERTNALFLVVAATIGLAACGSTPKVGKRTEATIAGVDIATVHLEALPETYEAVGTVRSATTSVLGAQISGTVREIRVKPGDRVKRGQVLALLDDRSQRAQLAAAKAGVEEAEFGLAETEQTLEAAAAERKLAEVTYKRYQELLAKNSVTRQEFDGAEARYKSALANEAAIGAKKKAVEARGQEAQSQHESAQTLFSYASIVSPIDGVVTSKPVDAGTLVMPGTPLLTVEDTAHFRLEATVPQELLSKIRLGQRAPVWTEGGQFDGEVIEIVPAADPASRTFVVKVALPAACACQSGEYGKASFATGEVKALTIPRSAVVERGQLQGVYVVSPQGTVEYRLITTGKRFDEQTEILSGLGEGERVATSRLDQLRDGTRVESQ